VPSPPPPPRRAGTHTAALVGGVNAGVAKKVNIYGVKVLSNKGGGSNANVINGINFVVNQAVITG
jgi:subtilisin family serine protease